ncbi:hypothetical protein NM208_g7409 [Fusarium decemcellulare]|uniref:Uncharacterized protein n=1 Tax=Fusarium decemcellulare TaxID=57161 RepID=A0ACC1S9F2_9HYPO|nr:hypothetical protein NM208_g7409 [Fusarium decemcellulare]
MRMPSMYQVLQLRPRCVAQINLAQTAQETRQGRPDQEDTNDVAAGFVSILSPCFPVIPPDGTQGSSGKFGVNHLAPVSRSLYHGMNRRLLQYFRSRSAGAWWNTPNWADKHSPTLRSLGQSRTDSRDPRDNSTANYKPVVKSRQNPGHLRGAHPYTEMRQGWQWRPRYKSRAEREGLVTIGRGCDETLQAAVAQCARG